MTKWTRETWRELREDKEFFTRLLEKSYCLMTLNGSGDEKIQPKGPKDYVLNEELCVACNISSMFSVLNLQPSFVFLHFLDPIFRSYTLIVGCTS